MSLRAIYAVHNQLGFPMHQQSARRWYPAVAALIYLVLCGFGCRALPEAGVKSFADTTATLKSTLIQAGQSAARDVADVNNGTDASKATAKLQVDELNKAWAKRVQCMAAMDQYAQSLSALVQA